MERGGRQEESAADERAKTERVVAGADGRESCRSALRDDREDELWVGAEDEALVPEVEMSRGGCTAAAVRRSRQRRGLRMPMEVGASATRLCGAQWVEARRMSSV